MNRSEFIKNMSLAFTGLVMGNRLFSAPEPKPNAKTYLLGEMPVAGFQYYHGEALLRNMKPGEEIQLQREPENKFDYNAIALYYRNQKIGYLPRAENQTIALLMDQKALITAQITETNTSANVDTWEKVWVEVKVG